jgi:hypothetical protein
VNTFTARWYSPHLMCCERHYFGVQLQRCMLCDNSHCSVDTVNAMSICRSRYTSAHLHKGSVFVITTGSTLHGPSPGWKAASCNKPVSRY